MTMQAAIVAGGRGMRMREALGELPKAMLPVGGRPLLEHQLEWLRASGVAEVFLCLGYKADAISARFGDGSSWGLRLSCRMEKEPRGTAGAVRDLMKDLAGDLLVVYGDLFVDMDLKRLKGFHKGHDGAATIVARPTDHPYDSDLLKTDGDRVTAIYRAKPGETVDNLGAAAVWIVRPRLLDLAAADAPSDFGRDVFPAALKKGETLMAYRTEETVVDIGTPERRDAFLERWARRGDRWAVFLDRDGVLNDEVGLIAKPEDLRLLPGATEAVKKLKEAGAVVVVVTNQPVVARGLTDETGLTAIHGRLEDLLAAGGAKLDGVFYCPHHPERNHPDAKDSAYRRECPCRKPKTGMLEAAASRFGLDLGRSFFIGDTTRDIQTARNAGCRSVLVRTGFSGKDGKFDAEPDAEAAGVLEAADWVLSRAGARA